MPHSLFSIFYVLKSCDVMFPGGTEACADDTRWPQSHRIIWPQSLLRSHHVCGLPGVWPWPHPSCIPRPPPQLQRGLQGDSGRFSGGCVCIRSTHDSVWLGGSGYGASFLHGVCLLRPGEADGELFWAVGVLLPGLWQPQDGEQTSVFYGAAEKITKARVRSWWNISIHAPVYQTDTPASISGCVIDIFLSHICAYWWTHETISARKQHYRNSK